MAVAFTTYGMDLDQLRSRSAVSRTAGLLYDVLWYPHDTIARLIPNPILVRPGVIPLILVGASLLWGCAAYLVVAFLRARRRV